MQNYTEIFDKRPLTYLGQNDQQEQVVVWYDGGLYHLPRNEYEYPHGAGNFIAGSDIIPVPESFAYTQRSGVDYIAHEKTGTVTVYEFDGSANELQSFSGNSPALCWGGHTSQSNDGIICYYLSGNEVKFRSNQDSFAAGYDVYSELNITDLKAAQETPENTGKISIFGIVDQFSGIILTNLSD